MIPATALGAQPEPWQKAWRDAVTDPHELLEILGLESLRAQVALPARREFPLRVPRGFVARMRRGDPHDPLLRQVLPLDLERREIAGFGADAVGDAAARVASGVIHKYAGRALLIATGSCAVHCRYCFRRHFPYAEETAAAGRWREAVDFFAAHPELDELILSGGDPLSLSTARLAELTDSLRERAPHLRRIRLHTRLPIVLPARADRALLDWLRGLPWPAAIVVHANHAAELAQDVVAAAVRLRSTGATLLNQSVLLAGVNDAEDSLAELSERLFDAGILPYYLHQLDRVAGTAHFEVPDERARALHEGLRRRLPGYLVPKLVREIAGEPYKTSL